MCAICCSSDPLPCSFSSCLGTCASYLLWTGVGGFCLATPRSGDIIVVWKAPESARLPASVPVYPLCSRRPASLSLSRRRVCRCRSNVDGYVILRTSWARVGMLSRRWKRGNRARNTNTPRDKAKCGHWVVMQKLSTPGPYASFAASFLLHCHLQRLERILQWASVAPGVCSDGQKRQLA